MAGISLKCGDCGILLRTVKEAEDHAGDSKHTNYVESDEPCRSLDCSVCGKTCLSQMERDLHTRRTGHRIFVLPAPRDVQMQELPLVPATSKKALTQQALRERARKKEEEEKQRETEMDKERRRAEKEKARREREIILQKMADDRAEIRRKLGLPPEYPILSPVRPAPTKVQQMGECLRSMMRIHGEDEARLKEAFRTLVTMAGRVENNPDEQKFRKIRIMNVMFQEKVAKLKGSIEFLELCGFEKIEGGEFLYLPREKVDIALLHSAGIELNNAINSPLYGAKA